MNNLNLANDLGDNNVLPIASVDLDNNPRIINSIIDLGAYEFYNPSIRASKPNNTLFRIFPNPAASTINIELLENYNEVFIEILTLDGKIAMDNLYCKTSCIKLDISLLPNGVYLLKATTDRDVFTDKFIKN
jgi:hypothetical protein